jgi:receptor protein-tyrosine kinase
MYEIKMKITKCEKSTEYQEAFMEETTMDLKDLFKIIKRRRVVIISITLMSILFGIIISFIPKSAAVVEVKKEVYKSTASIVIGTFPDIQSDNIKDITILNQQIVKIYGAVASSRTVAQKTMDELNLDVKIDDFMSNIKVITNPDNQVITIHYIYKEASNQQEVLTSYVKIFMEEAQKIYPTGNLKMLDEPSKVQKMSEEDFAKITIPQVQQQGQANVKQTVVQENSKNKKVIVVVAFVLGVMLGVGAAFLLEYIDNSVRKKEEVEEILKLNTLAIIQNNKSKENIKEAFRSLRTNLQLKEDKIFAVASAGEGEGKTEVSINLAKTFAEAGFKTLIIDGNGRNPKINKTLNLKDSKGISEMLYEEDSVHIEDVESNLLNTNIDNLNILSWGNVTLNPADLLCKDKLERLLEKLKNKFDYIIIDTPSMVDYCDAQILAKLSEGTLILVTEGKTDKNKIIRMKEILDISYINVRGVAWIEGVR